MFYSFPLKDHNRIAEMNNTEMNGYFDSVLNALVKLHGTVVYLPGNQYPYEIAKNRKFYLYFKNALGAIEGTNIMAHISSNQVTPFRK